jgi:phosphoribosylamine---glycine ligase
MTETTRKHNILVIGSGGREHALVQALTRSASCASVHTSPGSDGIAQHAPCHYLPTSADVVTFCQTHAIDLVIIGPEQPLVDGWADDFRAAGIATFGPSAAAAQLEASKDFTKKLCDRYAIPTARYASFNDATSALEYVRMHGAPIVVKADGLAAGKGVTVAETLAEAEAAIQGCFGGAFGEAGARVVLEEKMEGPEVSFFALCDGTHALAFCHAQDHKRAFDGDTGPNTGGMGTYSPVPVFTKALEEEVMVRMILPTVQGLAAEGTPYVGVLFAGLMLTATGPKLIEYNCRFGDPETQAMLARFTGDLAALLYSCAVGNLHASHLQFSSDAAVCVVMATRGYPGNYSKGSIIGNLSERILHAGTRLMNDQWQAHGGRVLNIVGTGATITEAATQAYATVSTINWPEGFCRSDIAWQAR